MASPSGTSLAPPSSAPQPTSGGSRPTSNPANGTQQAGSDGLPATSVSDPGLTRRPRDARLLHLLLSSLPLTAYSERVPLQLLDFAYRYTSSILSDAQHLSAEGYATTVSGNTARANAAAQEGHVALAAVRLSVASRMGWQFKGQAGKEAMLELAGERNRILLPRITTEGYGGGSGVMLPPEKWVLSGVGWGVAEDWVDAIDGGDEERGSGGKESADVDPDVDERMEDLFGEGPGGGEADEPDDRDMADV